MKRRKVLLILVLLICAMLAAFYGYHRWRYPYGWSHACDTGLKQALDQYAESHDGTYP